MTKLKIWKDFLKEKLEYIKKIEDAEDKRPPKEWWDNCYETIKKKNPKYTDEQIRGTCGKIYHKMGVRKKIGDFIEDILDVYINIVNDAQWMSEAVKRPGGLHKALGIPEDKKIPISLINEKISALQKKAEGDKKLSPEDKHMLEMLLYARTAKGITGKKKKKEDLNDDENIIEDLDEPEKEGRWVTIRGTHIFIKKGQSTREAMDKTFGSKKQAKKAVGRKTVKEVKGNMEKGKKIQGKLDKNKKQKADIDEQINTLEDRMKGEKEGSERYNEMKKLYLQLGSEQNRLSNERTFLKSKKEKFWKEQDKIIEAKLKERKKDFQIVNDFITTDFQVINDSTLGGYVVRDGGFQYGIDSEGNPIIRYKDWDNLQDAYRDLQAIPAYGSRYQDSHYESDDRFIGYWDTFEFYPKGLPGKYAQDNIFEDDPNYNKKMDIDENHNRIWARLNTEKHISQLSDLPLEALVGLPTSASYDDLGKGNQQIVGKVHHIAVSLNKNEQDRCSTLNGTPCNVSLIKDTVSQIHNHDLIEEESASNDQDITKGVLRADFSQPPTNKKGDARMGKNKEKDIEKTEDMKTTKEGEAPEYEKEEKEPLLEEENESNPKKPTITKKDTVEPDAPIQDYTELMDYIKKLEAKVDVLEDFKKESDEKKKIQEAKDFEELKEVLSKEPYNVPENLMENKNLTWLQEKKDFLDNLPHIQDFLKDQPSITHEDVQKHLFDFQTISHDPVMAVFGEIQRESKKTLDFLASEEQD